MKRKHTKTLVNGIKLTFGDGYDYNFLNENNYSSNNDMAISSTDKSIKCSIKSVIIYILKTNHGFHIVKNMLMTPIPLSFQMFLLVTIGI